MLNPKTVKSLLAVAALSSAILLPAAAAQPFSAPTAQVSFMNTSDLFGTVDVYVDGVKTASSLFNSTPSLFPSTVAAGTHQIVVTRAGSPLGQQDLLSKTVNIPAGGSYTLAIDNTTAAGTMNSVTGYTLKLQEGDQE